MKDKEKIEEIAKLLNDKNASIVYWDYYNDDRNPSYKKELKNVASIIYNAGYRKLPENAFILTNDNAEELANLIVTSPQMQSAMSDLIKAWQKETAEKIFEKIFEDFNIDCGTFSLNMARKSYMNAQLEQTNLALRKRFSQLAKQFGVEIKE